MKSARVLVTGGAGFIGSALVRYLVGECNAEVLNIDKLTYAGNLSSLRDVEDLESFGHRTIDVCDADGVAKAFAEFQPDFVMHLATESHVDRSIDGPAEFIRTNVVGTYTLLDCAWRYWRQLPPEKQNAFRFHLISTDEVYGSLGKTGLFTETTPYAPRSPYSASKAAADHLLMAWHHTYGLPTVLTNCSNNYGAYQFPEKLIPLVTVNILEGKPLPIYGDGKQIRDWLEVNDHCRGIELVLEGGRIGETYNIGGNCERQNIEIVKTICAALDAAFAGNAALAERYPDAPPAKGKASHSLITHVKDRLGHDRRYAVDASKITNALGYAPAEDFTSGFQKTLEWYLTNETWWQHVRDDSYRDWVTKQYGND